MPGKRTFFVEGPMVTYQKTQETVKEFHIRKRELAYICKGKKRAKKGKILKIFLGSQGRSFFSVEVEGRRLERKICEPEKIHSLFPRGS